MASLPCSEIDLAFLDIEHRVCRVALQKDGLPRAVVCNTSALADLGEKGARTEWVPLG